MRTEAQNRVCSAVEQMIVAHRLCYESRVLHGGARIFLLAENAVHDAEDEFISSLNAAIDERIQAATGTRP